MNRIRVILAGVVLVVASSLLFFFLAKNRPKPPREPAIVLQTRQAAQEKISLSERLDINDPELAERLLTCLFIMDQREDGAKPSADSFVQFSLEFLRVYATGDAEAYMAWRKKRGATLDAEQTSGQQAANNYDYWANRKYSDRVTEEDYFSIVFENHITKDRWVGRLTEVAVSGECGILLLGTSPPVEHPYWISETLERADLEMFMRWYGPDVGNGWPLWKPEHTFRDIQERDGEVVIAQTVFGVVNDRGQSMLCHITGHYDPLSGQWRLTGASLGKTDGVVGVMVY